MGIEDREKITFSNFSKDYYEIISLLEDLLDEEEISDDLNRFDRIKYYFEKYSNLIGGINSSLFYIRAALMTLDDFSYKYLSSIESAEIKKIINDIDPGYHPLMAAVKRGDHDGVLYLLKNGAKLNDSTEPWFPLLQADQNRDKKMLAILERYGASWEKCLRVYQSWRKKPYKRKVL